MEVGSQEEKEDRDWKRVRMRIERRQTNQNSPNGDSIFRTANLFGNHKRCSLLSPTDIYTTTCMFRCVPLLHKFFCIYHKFRKILISITMMDGLSDTAQDLPPAASKPYIRAGQTTEVAVFPENYHRSFLVLAFRADSLSTVIYVRHFCSTPPQWFCVPHGDDGTVT